MRISSCVGRTHAKLQDIIIFYIRYEDKSVSVSIAYHDRANIIVNSVLRLVYHFLAIKYKRQILAGFFIFVFIAEIGSHVAICSDHSPVDETSVTMTEGEHDDPCKTLVTCSDSNRNDHQTQNLRHDASQHNALYDRGLDFLAAIEINNGEEIPPLTGHAIFRPPSPPFQPPQIS